MTTSNTLSPTCYCPECKKLRTSVTGSPVVLWEVSYYPPGYAPEGPERGDRYRSRAMALLRQIRRERELGRGYLQHLDRLHDEVTRLRAALEDAS